MKDIIIGGLVILLIINTVFIWCCLRISSKCDKEE